jgi:hypothetical protein
MDLIADGVRGQMVGIRDGSTPIRRCGPARRPGVDVATMYNVDRFGPAIYRGLLGHPLLLGQSLAATD